MENYDNVIALPIHKKKISIINNPSEVDFTDVYMKKPMKVRAKKMDEDFSIRTLEGTIIGKAGDYIILGKKNEIYPCRKDIFEEIYTLIEEEG